MSNPSSPYKTLSDIRNAIIKDCKETTSSNFVAQVDRWINEGHEQVILRKKRDWLDQQFTVQLASAVQAVCTVTNGSTTVTFSTSSSFVSGIELQFQNQGFQEVYNVASFTNNVVTLDQPYLGDSSTAASGIIFQSSVLLDGTIRSVYQAYHQYRDQPLEDLGPQQMRQLQEAGQVQTDYATYMSIFGQSGYQRRLQLYPYPLYAYTLYLDANCFVPVLSSNGDEPTIPMQYRQILYWYGMYKSWLYHRNDGQAAQALTNFNSMLSRIDGEQRAEIDFPQISVKYPRTRTLVRFKPPFDIRYRDN